MRRGIILVTGSDRRRCWKTRISKGLLQVGLQGKVGLSSFRVGILTIAGFAETVVQHLVSLLKRGLVEAGFAKVALVRLDPSVNVLVLFQMRRPFEVAGEGRIHNQANGYFFLKSNTTIIFNE